MSNSLAATADPIADIKLDGISHIAVKVDDLAAARDFYRGVLGFSLESGLSLPECGQHAVLSTASGQHVALCLDAGFAPLPDTGIHNGYRVSPQARQTILDRLAKENIEVFSYREIRPAEAAENCYFYDPSGNRLQLVCADGTAAAANGSLVDAIDHVTVQASDVHWSEDFYARRLAMPIDAVVGWRTADYVLAKRWKEGAESMAPGQMRLDKRYSTIHGTDPVPRANMQLFVKAGDACVGVYLATRHFQMPPEELQIGTPRVAFRVSRNSLKAIAAHFKETGHAAEGPIAHSASPQARHSLYTKDTNGNFIEFVSP
ncbi:MAG TPA: VOC family protein [Alphaproteobacteria bacterium]|jgi:catechol 2,3-dioxygenase-like lactoylglutathione lyase family enzyme